jgi:hypothetical protein
LVLGEMIRGKLDQVRAADLKLYFANLNES